jgi:hypothetical protein
MATPSFQTVQYIDPWGTLPPGVSAGGGGTPPGVQVSIANSGSAPQGNVVIARLLQSGAPVAYGVGATAGVVVVVPPGPLTAALPYQVQAQWAPGGTDPAGASWTGPEVISAPVLTTGLAISAGSVSASSVAFAWMPEGAAQPAYGYVQVFDAVTGKAASILLAAGGSGSAPFAYVPGNTYVAYAAAAALISPSVPGCYTIGPLAPAKAVPVAAPALGTVAYDGTTLSVGWTAPALPASPVVVDPAYSLLLYAGGTLVGSFGADAGGGTAVVDVAALGASVSVVGAVSYGAIRGPAGTSGAVTVVAGAPSVSGLVATASTVTATLTAPAAASGITGYQAFLYEDGRQVAGPAGATDSGGTLTAAFAYAMNAQRRYTVRAQGIGATAAVSGPLGPEAAVVSSVPGGIVTSYDGTAVTATWAPLPDAGVSGYTATLASMAGTAGSPVTVQGTTAVIPAAGLSPSTAYTVSVAANGGQAVGPSSAGVPVVVETVGVTAAAYDGSTLTLSWAAAAAGGASYLVQVSANGAVVASQASVQTSAAVPVSLSPGTAYSVAVRVVSGAAVGPSGPAAGLVSAIPGVGPVTATGSEVAATVLPPSPAPNVSGYQGWLYEGDAVVAGPVQATTSDGVTSVAFAYTLQPQGDYTVRAQAAGASAAFAGPVGPGMPVIASAVSGISTVYDGTSVTAEWHAPADARVTGYVATLADSGGVVAGSPVTVDGTRALLPASGLSPGTAYQVTVRALGGQATGPESEAAPVVVETVAVTSAAYDGAVLSLAWGAAQTQGASYLAEVSAGGAVVASQASTGTGAAVPVPLSPGTAYSVAVRVVSGSATGPMGAATGLVSAVPCVGPVTATASSVTAGVVVPSPASNVTGYQGWLYDGDAVVAGPVPATTSDETTTVSFPYAVSAERRYSVRIGATGAGSASGPMGAAGPLISAAPAVAQTSYDGSAVTASWPAVLDPSVTAYVATLAEVGGAAAGSPVTVEGTSVSLPAASLDLSKSYQVTVQAASGSATGPAGAAGSVVTESVAVTASSYDGALLSLTWAAAQAPGATYVVQVHTDGTVVAEQASARTYAQIPVELAADRSYTATVRVVSGTATGPAGTPGAVVAALPGVSSVVATAGEVTATLAVPSSAPNVSGYRGWLYEGGAVVAGPVQAATSGGVTTAAFPYAVLPQTRYTVQVQAVGSSPDFAGPVSAPAPVLSSVPRITASGYDGSTVTVAWEASSDPNVSGYLATLSTADGTVVGAPVATAFPRATIPAASLSLDADYVVTVQATAGTSAGPASDPADPLADSVGFFFPDQSSTAYPYLFRGDLRAPGASNITLYLPELFSGTLAASIVQDPFTLSTTPEGSAFPLVLTVPQDAGIDVWNVNQNGIRANLQAAYQAFLAKVEADTAGLLPGALNVLRQAIAQGLPLTFAETLYYTYGLDPSAGAVDLMAGTRLRVDYEEYQSVPPGSGQPQPLLSGYTGAGTSVYDVGSQPPAAGVVPLGMSAFFSALPVPTVAASSGGGGGILDLIASDFQMPYLRLLFPPTIVSADSGGRVGVSGNIVFLAAMSYTQLQAATAMYNATQGFTGVTGISYTYFRGRAALFPEVPVRVDGSVVHVPVGTTVRQVVERVAALPYGVSQALTGFAMRRPIGAVVEQQDAYAAGYALGRSNQVHFGPQGLSTYRYTSGLDAFDLPVLGGDVFVLADEPAGDG